MTIGRASTNDIKFPDTKISRNHCKILLEDGKAVFYDLGSSRGSKVNNERVTTQALQVGDTIKIGATVLTVDCTCELLALLSVMALWCGGGARKAAAC